MCSKLPFIYKRVGCFNVLLYFYYCRYMARAPEHQVKTGIIARRANIRVCAFIYLPGERRSDMEFMDRLLTCGDCGGEFIFTAGEQLFFFDKQFKNDPKRCKPCKSKRAGRTGTGVIAGGLLRTETRTECSACGVETTVPFKPTQGRPVLCRQCFQGRLPTSLPAPEALVARAELSAATAKLIAAATGVEHGVLAIELIARTPPN